jgi:hypothetical protein
VSELKIVKGGDAMNNRHPVDELADVREELRRLEAREKELREMLLADGADLIGDDLIGDDLIGDEWRARRIDSSQRRLDQVKLVARFGEGAVDECRSPITCAVLRLKKRAQDRSREVERFESKNFNQR